MAGSACWFQSYVAPFFRAIQHPACTRWDRPSGLPNDLESSIKAAVRSGWFASVDDAMAEAARLLLRTIQHEPKPPPAKPAAPQDPLLGIFRDAPEEIDEIVAEAMQRRREEPWRAFPSE
jgi:Arc/MetJ-type ribon-helix-helix transcriptional regulator